MPRDPAGSVSEENRGSEPSDRPLLGFCKGIGIAFSGDANPARRRLASAWHSSSGGCTRQDAEPRHRRIAAGNQELSRRRGGSVQRAHCGLSTAGGSASCPLRRSWKWRPSSTGSRRFTIACTACHCVPARVLQLDGFTANLNRGVLGAAADAGGAYAGIDRENLYLRSSAGDEFVFIGDLHCAGGGVLRSHRDNLSQRNRIACSSCGGGTVFDHRTFIRLPAKATR